MSVNNIKFLSWNFYRYNLKKLVKVVSFMLFLDDKDICYDGEVSLNSDPNVSILSSFFFMLASIAIVTVVALIAC